VREREVGGGGGYSIVRSHIRRTEISAVLGGCKVSEYCSSGESGRLDT
jgi:hypothetical protein